MALTLPTESPTPGRAATLDDGMIAESAGWFGPESRPLFGWFVYPKDLLVRGAVVLCQPIAEEANMAYRTFRTLSQKLARAGYLVLRFDYDGTGDSAGSFEDPGRVTAWTRSIATAVDEVRAWGVTEVSLVGMRLGATLAYLAAADPQLKLDQLVLWDPCVSGKAYLRELQLLQNAWIGDRRRAPEGWVETPSYRFTPDFAAEAHDIAIDHRVPVTDLARSTTVLVRPDRTPSAMLVAALPRDIARWGEALGQGELLGVQTLDAAVPQAGIAAVVATFAGPNGDPSTRIVPRLTTEARWIEDGVQIIESAGFFGRDAGLFGITTSGAAPNALLPQLLLLNVAAERHLGEGRIWLRLARSACADGFVSVRLDHGGVGDSATRPGGVEDLVYDEGWIDEVPEVSAQLSTGGRGGVVGIGLCSSGASALQAGLAGAFREVIAVNVALDIDLNENLPTRWTIFARKPRWLTTLAVKHRRVSEAIWSASSVIAPTRDVLWMCREIVARGDDVTLIGGPDDVGRIRQSPLWKRTWGRVLSRSGRFRLLTVANADHSLRSSSGQDDALEAMLDRLAVYRETTGSDQAG